MSEIFLIVRTKNNIYKIICTYYKIITETYKAFVKLNIQSSYILKIETRRKFL